MGNGESDQPIVVRDGKADHTAKGLAGRHSPHSTHARGGMPRQSVSSSLRALGQKARADRKHRFRNLYGMIDLPMLYDCFRELRRGAVPGVDGVDVACYEQGLDRNLGRLAGRLKSKRYRAHLVKRR